MEKSMFVITDKNSINLLATDNGELYPIFSSKFEAEKFISKRNLCENVLIIEVQTFDYLVSRAMFCGC